MTSVFVSGGDAGAAACDAHDQQAPAQQALSVNGFASTAYNTAVGGTEFNDGGNGSGYVELGRLCMMDCWEPAYNFGADNNAQGMEANTPRVNSLGGVGYFNRRKPARTFNFGFAVLPADELPVLRRIRKICNLDRQVVVIPDPDDTANLNDTCFLATLRQHGCEIGVRFVD